jgi:N-acetylglutamate synthase-like GNAT family acetyltransferase
MPLGTRPAAFSEKGFYLQEFRGRTLALCASPADLRADGPLGEVIRELASAGIRAVVISADGGALQRLGVRVVVPEGSARLAGDVWRALGESHAVGVEVGAGPGFAADCRSVGARLGVTKLVFLQAEGGLVDDAGERISFVDLEELERRIHDASQPRGALMREIHAMLDEAEIAAVNLCSVDGLADELFSYAGSGTLFTPKRYLDVRRLGVDDYDAARDLIARGVDEGYLAARSSRELDRVLAGGFGAFVEGRHLAGIGALLEFSGGAEGEIASLYTLTRFLGEGVGAHLVSHAVTRANQRGLERVFACTTQERVGQFFERNGFSPVALDALPKIRWEGYDEERRTRVRCYQRDTRSR